MCSHDFDLQRLRADFPAYQFEASREGVSAQREGERRVAGPAAVVRTLLMIRRDEAQVRAHSAVIPAR